MNTLDVDQQWELLQQQQRQNGDELPKESFMQMRFYVAVMHVAAPVLILSLVAAIFMLFPPIISKKFYEKAANHIRCARAGLLSASLDPWGFSALMTLWICIIGINTVLSVMKVAAREPVPTVLGERLVMDMGVKEWLLTQPVLFFLLELFGAVSIWVYMLFMGGKFAIGALVSLIPFFPSFYQSLVLQGDEPDRLPLWVTHFVFLGSLLLVSAFATPWIKNEINAAKDQLQRHTTNALYRDRPEVAELRARMKQLEALQRTNKSK